MMPPTVTVASAPQPGRLPARHSVSLLQSSKNPSPLHQSDTSSDSLGGEAVKIQSKPADGTPSCLQPLGRDSSGQSSIAERWFEKANSDVQCASPTSDNEPPFFMRNSSSSETPPYAPGQLIWNGRADPQSLLLRTGFLHLGMDASSTEDFRSVIDDLTIENKKLKRKLNKYEKLHDSHLEDEKLFEVRIHGLQPAKKRELEDTLRKFVSSLANNCGAESFANGYESLLPMPDVNKAASSQTSLQNTDSAYVSMSASGRGGSSAQSGGDKRHSRTFSPSAASRRQNIHSYLHHIPEGLLPQPNPATMSERAKKKVVVKRLEQLFAGRGAAVAGHQQPQQQQEVSQMAARADRSALEAQGQRAREEGKREANMIQQKAGANQSPDEANAGAPVAVNVGGQNFAQASPSQSLLEQRPTRPLDLDPYRAQVPSDNIAYFRHLGFSTPDPHAGQDAEEGRGWIYLNVLINMAQLHTINVTVEFVRKALSEYSDMYELSADRRKIRWKGFTATTRTSTDSDSPSAHQADDDVDPQSPRKRPRLSHRTTPRPTITNPLQSQGGATQRSGPENSKFLYIPMFHHRDGTEDSASSSDEDEEDATESACPIRIAGDYSGMTSSGVRTTSAAKKNKKAKDDGPIIFYKNASFCTDLSGERNPHASSDTLLYTKFTIQAVGQPQADTVASAEKRGDLRTTSQLPEPMNFGDHPIPKSIEITFPPDSPLKPDTVSEKKPVAFEVSGLGGVWPADNFAIDIQSQHVRSNDVSAQDRATQSAPRSLPPKFTHMLHAPDGGGRTRAAIHKVQIQAVSSQRKELPPSQLPPALSFVPLSDELYDDEGSDAEDGMSVSPESPVAPPPSAAPQAMKLLYTHSAEDADDESEAESDSSLDLLAAAREVDPEAIRAREREYDANIAERLAEEILAGSGAATAGGSSGFASPSSGVKRREYRRAVQKVRASVPEPAGSRKAHTSDSMQVQGLHDSADTTGIIRRRLMQDPR